MAAHSVRAAEHWDIEPYRIHISLAIDAPGNLAELLAAELPAYLQDRTAATVGVIWRLDTEVAAGPFRHRLLDGLESLANSDLPEPAAVEDKRLFVTIQSTPWGYHLAAREFDRYVQRWGRTIGITIRQRDALPEQLFALVRQAVSPLAHLQPETENEQQVILELRGSALPRKSADFQEAEPGEVFLPILRRTNRDGKLVPNGAQVIPYTYVEVLPNKAKQEGEPQIVGRVRSGSRRPLAARRGGRTEQVAIAVQPNAVETIVSLHSRTQRDKPLLGYEVSVKDTDGDAARVVGLSDGNGEVRVAPGKTTVQTLYVRSGGMLLARVPVVPGIDDRIELPLPDEDVRLQAEAKLAAIREDLVDLVARRNIVMARVRQELEEKNYDRARELLESLDQLPGRTQFNSALEREARAHRTSDPQVQRRIDQLFTATQTALGTFLDPRPINELHEQLRKARDKETRRGGEKESS